MNRIYKCEGCGEEFRTRLRSDRVAQYCSTTCFRKYRLPSARLKGHAILGEKLGKTFRTAADFQKEYECPACHSMFPHDPCRPKTFCNVKCFHDYWRGRPKKPAPPRPGRTFKWQRILAREAYGNKCNRCGYDTVPEILQVHHRDHNPKNPLVENLELLCPNCHETEHFLTKTGRFGTHSRKKKTDGPTYAEIKAYGTVRLAEIRTRVSEIERE